MIDWLLMLFARLFQGLENNGKRRDKDRDKDLVLGLDVGSVPDERNGVNLSVVEDVEPTEKTLPERISDLMEDSQWELPIDEMPKTRSQIYKIYGNPVKSKKSKKYPRAEMVVARDLPGAWNNDSKKLYVHVVFASILRQAFWLIESIVGYVPFKRIGSYFHRNIRFNKSLPLSLHSWGIALDVDPDDNRVVTRGKTWMKKVKGRWVSCPPAQAKRGPVSLPFDKTWISAWPKGVSYEVVLCFLAVGLTWGATWSFPHDQWTYFVDKYGVGYDPMTIGEDDLKLYNMAVSDWQRVRFIDPMHFEARNRQPPPKGVGVASKG